AAAAQCELSREPIGRVYQNMVTDERLLNLYVRSAADFGRVVERPDEGNSVVGSTDMGNVSHVVPSIHPLIKVGPSDVPLHTRSFADYAGGSDGDSAVLDGAATLALTTLRVLELGVQTSVGNGERTAAPMGDI